MTANKKPEYGKRLIPQILDDLALADPDCIVYSIASFSHDEPSFRDISARELTQAIDKTAWWLCGQLHASNRSSNESAHPSSKIQSLGYVGPRAYDSNNTGFR